MPLVDGDEDQQYVCVTLQVILVEGYPEVRPKFRLKNPRGLGDSSLMTMERAINAKLDDCLGQPVVFDLIEVVREHLTEDNLPSGQCVVCLYGFHDGDQFTRTPCYHYLHSYCLLRHLNASRRNYDEEFDKLPAWQQKTAKPYSPVCPVCREAIDYDVETLCNAEAPSELVNAPRFQLTSEIRDLQTKMAHIYLRQKNRGGIIDVDAEETAVIAIDDGIEEQERQRREERRLLEVERREKENEMRKQPSTKTHKSSSHKDCPPSKGSRHHHHNRHHHNHHHHRHHHATSAGQEAAGANMTGAAAAAAPSQNGCGPSSHR